MSVFHCQITRNWYFFVCLLSHSWQFFIVSLCSRKGFKVYVTQAPNTQAAPTKYKAPLSAMIILSSGRGSCRHQGR